MSEQPYGGPYGGYPSPTGFPVPTQTSGKAIAALVTGILSLVFCGLFTGIPAIVLGISSNREIKASQGRLTGGGLAVAGIVTGILGTLISVVIIALFVLGAAVFSHTSDCTSDGTSTTCTEQPARVGAP